MDNKNKKYQTIYLKSNAYNMLGFLFDRDLVAFDCADLVEAALMDVSGIEDCETAEEMATACNKEIIPFDESEWEEIIDLDDPNTMVDVAVFSEYKSKGGIGSDKIFATADEALTIARSEWYRLSSNDKKQYDSPGSCWYVYSARIPFSELAGHLDPYGSPKMPLSEYEDFVLWGNRDFSMDEKQPEFENEGGLERNEVTEQLSEALQKAYGIDLD